MDDDSPRDKHSGGDNTRDVSKGTYLKKVILLVASSTIGIATLIGIWTGYLAFLPHASVVDGTVVGDKVKLVITNSGNTTAYQTVLKDPFIYVGEYPPKIGALSVKANQPADLPAGAEFIYEHRIKPPNKNELKRKRVAVYASGTIEYTDWFGVHYAEPFDLIYGGDYSTEGTQMGVWRPAK